MTFGEWLKVQEMFTTQPPSTTNMSPKIRADLKQVTAVPTGRAKLPRWRKVLHNMMWWKRDQ